MRTDMDDERERIEAAEGRWRNERLGGKDVSPEALPCGIPVEPLYTPADAPGDFLERIGFPGEYPFTRGVYPTMYRGRHWTMRQYAGFGTAEESNRRYRYLLDQGQTGLSVALDLPTQCGYDSDDPMAEAEVGRVGVAIDTLRDMEILFDGLPLGEVSTSFTINGTAAIILAMYLAVAERRGVPWDRVAGTIQNDILKEYVARGTWIFPVLPSVRLIVDTIAFCAERAPRFNPISIAGAHFRDAGGTAVQEAAFTLADAFAYVEAVRARGIDVDRFAPQLSFFFYTYTDLFEEVAKYRAMRRLWARAMRDRFGARKPESMMFRFGNVCGGHSLTREEPLNNIARVTLEALASVLGGTQSMFTASWDEAYAIPGEESARTALRIQQVLAHESGAARTVDPLAGSYYVEALTDQMERAIEAELARVEAQGGMVSAIERGWVQREIHREAYRQELDRQEGRRVVVGVNRFRTPAPPPALTLHRADPALAGRQVARLAEVRASRDAGRVEAALAAVREAALGSENLMPALLDAVRALASVGEISGVLREAWGVFREPAVV
jgi:methylmalonyl-CoA mutase N-terminal domain/subunit